MGDKSGWIGCDLDGTLAKYDKWRGIDHIGDPVLPMLARVKAWLEEGKTVKIFTARVHGHGRWLLDPGIRDAMHRHGELQEKLSKRMLSGALRELTEEMAEIEKKFQADAITPIENWCEKHIGQKLEVTNVKDYGMIELWDDRAIQVRMNAGERVG